MFLIRRRVKPVVILLVIDAVLLCWFNISQHHWISSKSHVLKALQPTHFYNQATKVLNLLEPSLFSKQTDFKCLTATVADLSFPMCVYDKNDDEFISGGVHEGKYFESALVTKILNFMRNHIDVTFVDLGANLGTYSLPVAHSGIHVVAVEPNNDTVRRLAKSIYIGKIEHRIDLFHYAVSNETSNMFLENPSNNTKGRTFLSSNASCEGCLSTNVTILNNFVSFFRNKKAVMKVDTEASEIRIFQQHSAGKFFDDIDVLMIQMEWAHYPMKYNGNEHDRRQVDRLLEFFYEREYDVYDPLSENKLHYDLWNKWPYDVVFKKKNLPTDRLYFL